MPLNHQQASRDYPHANKNNQYTGNFSYQAFAHYPRTKDTAQLPADEYRNRQSDIGKQYADIEVFLKLSDMAG